MLDCAEKRTTLIGWNKIKPNEADLFRIPLPLGLEGQRGFRSLSVTIAWFTPISYLHHKYRMVKFEISPGGNKKFSIGVDNAKNQPEYKTLGMGTVYHRRWESKRAANFVDNGNLMLDVICSPTMEERLNEEIRYAVALTLEVGQDINVSVYDEMREQLEARVAVKP